MGLIIDFDDGQTPLDEEEKEGLKIKSITTQGELDEFEQLNIEKAIEWIIRSNLKPQKILTEKFVKNLHKKMYGDVWKWAGEYRKSDKNLGIKWPQISVELSYLLDDARYWISNHSFPSEEIAIRFKHRIVSIHCFANGNGRHSRIMADIFMEFIFGLDIFSWHQSKRIKADEVRNKYISALKCADNGNIIPLIEFAKG